ncbi:MAG: DMT family transporter [Promethearchaeota archaeon]
MDNRSSAYIAGILAAVLWGTPFTVVKIGLSILSPPLPPLGYLLLRFLVSLLLLTPLLIFSTPRNDIFTLLKKKFIIILGLINGLAYILQFIGQSGTTAAIATLMASTYLISTPFFSSLFQGTKITLRLKLAVTGGIFGVLVVSWSFSTQLAPNDTIDFLISTFLVLLSGLVWGAYGVISSILNKKATQERIREMNNSSAVFTSSSFYSVLIVGFMMFILDQSPSIESLTIEAWITVIYLAIFCTILPFILYIYASKSIKATELNVILLLNIVVGLLTANLLLSESLSVISVLGSLLIISSIYLASSNHRSLVNKTLF